MKITQKVRRIISGILGSIMLICLIPAAVVHADASLGMSVSGNTEVGSTITVSVSVDGGPYANFDGGFTYDSALLELKSITSGNYSAQNFKASGSNFVEYGANFSGAVIVVATFTCKAAGAATVSCSLGALGDMSGVDVAVSGASKSITITTPAIKSSNADLASLAISPGTLTPAFSAGTQSYSASVAANQSKITVSAAPADSKATVALNGVQNSLVSGKNTVKVTVTAENGATKVYSIVVTKTSGPTPTPAPTPVPLPLMQYNGTDYTILKPGSSDTVPEGFSPATAKFKGVDIPVLQKKIGDAADASVISIVLLTADGKTSFFVYDAASESCYPYQLISSTVMSFQILDKSVAPAIPDGYEVFDYTYLDNTVSAYRLISDPSNPQILLYLMAADGISSFYYYDSQNAMLMQYRGAVTITAATPAPSLTPTPSATDSPTPAAAVITLPAAASGITFNSLSDYKNPVVLLIYLLALLCLALLIVCIVLIAKKSAVYEPEDDGYDEDPDIDPIPPDDSFDTPLVSPRPQTFFNDFGHSPVDNDLYFGDKPPAEDTKLDFPAIPQRGDARQIPSQSIPVQPIVQKPAALQSFVTPAAPSMSAAPSPFVKQPAQPFRPVQRVMPEVTDEHVPVRLRHELEAEKAQNAASQTSQAFRQRPEEVIQPVPQARPVPQPVPQPIPQVRPGPQPIPQPRPIPPTQGNTRGNPADQVRRPKPNTNDPDYDPDDV